ncbi:MAG TPA: hypothetical protein VKA60_04535 [Blastocatellia bacterium]|nr:hypothetical protein [Blastocatellia bacterium]
MLRRSITAVGLLVALVASAQAAQAVKGYELYSWKVKGRWHYAVIAGTNRAKSYDEITAKASERIGINALTSELKRLPRGETLLWRSAAHAGVSKPRAKGSPILELPSRHRIQRIRAICEKLGLRLTLS